MTMRMGMRKGDDEVGQEARLTLIDVIYFLAALFFLAALSEPFADGFAAASSSMSPGTQLAWGMILPFSVLVLISLIYRKSISGR